MTIQRMDNVLIVVDDLERTSKEEAEDGRHLTRVKVLPADLAEGASGRPFLFHLRRRGL